MRAVASRLRLAAKVSAAALLLAALARAQDGPPAAAPDPVHVTVKGPREPVPAGGRFDVVLKVEVDAPYHIYAHDSPSGLPTKVEAAPVEGEKGAGLSFVEVVQPEAAAQEKYDPVLEEKLKTLEGSFEFRASFQAAADAQPGPREVQASITYMACDAKGCLFPVDRSFSVPVTVGASGGTAAAPAGGATSPAGEAKEIAPTAKPPTAAPAPAPEGEGGSLERQLSHALQQGDVGGLLWLSLVFGFVSLLTPCVFPMIPITVSFFSKRASEAGGRGARFALAYGLGIMATYTGFGMAMAALLGASSLQSLATNPWANLVIAGLFVFFGLSLMGFYDLRPPAFLVRRAEGGVAPRPGFAPVFVMGFIFTITAFTCTAPIVGSLLAALASGGSPVLIALGMLVYSAAFALPFVLLAAFPGMVQALPGAGGWMVTLKAFLGFVELVAALKFFSNADLVWDLQLLTRPAMLAVTLLLVGALALYLFGAFRLPHDVGGRRKGLSLRLLVALAVLLAFLYLARGLGGRPLDSWTEAYLPPEGYGLAQVGGGGGGGAAEGRVAWIEDYEAGLAQAKREGKRAFVDFTGVTCVNCRIVEKKFFSDPRFAEASRKHVMIKAITDRQSDEFRAHDLANQQRMAGFGSVTLPLYVLLGPDGKVIATSGYRPDFTVDWFLQFLETPAP